MADGYVLMKIPWRSVAQLGRFGRSFGAKWDVSHDQDNETNESIVAGTARGSRSTWAGFFVAECASVQVAVLRARLESVD